MYINSSLFRMDRKFNRSDFRPRRRRDNRVQQFLPWHCKSPLPLLLLLLLLLPLLLLLLLLLLLPGMLLDRHVNRLHQRQCAHLYYVGKPQTTDSDASYVWWNSNHQALVWFSADSRSSGVSLVLGGLSIIRTSSPRTLRHLDRPSITMI